MSRISKRTISLMAKLMELGYTADRIKLFFRKCEVPDTIMGKHEGGKEVYSAKIMYDLYDLDSEDSKKILRNIAKGLLLKDGTSPEYFVAKTGFNNELEKLKISLENDGFKIDKNELVSIVDENPGQEKRGRRKQTDSVFLCHSSKDSTFVKRLAEDLTRNGINVWFDEWDLEIGHDLTVKIQEGIKEQQFLAIILSPDAMTSEWVKKELNSGFIKEIEEKRVVVLPLLYKECELLPFLKGKRYADFRDSEKYEESLNELVKRIKGEGKRPVQVIHIDSEKYVHKIMCRIRGNLTISKNDMIQITKWFPETGGLAIIRMGNLTSESEYMGDEPMMTVQSVNIKIVGTVAGNISYSNGETRFILGMTNEEHNKYLEHQIPKKHPMIP